MTDQKNPAPAPKPVESASAAPGEKRAAVRPRLAKASESGDPAVQKALADLWTAQQNAAAHKDLAESSAAAAEGHDEDVAKAQAALAELGFE